MLSEEPTPTAQDTAAFAAALFQREALSQADAVVYADKQAHAALERAGHPGSSQADEVQTFWFYVDCSLNSMIRIANIFWPGPGPGARPAAKVRAQQLRTKLGLDEETDPALRALRNAFEHYDERMDSLLASGTQFLDDRRVGHSGVPLSFGPDQQARYYELDTRRLFAFGRDASYGEAVSATGDLASHLRNRAAVEGQGFWSPWEGPGATVSQPS